MKSRWIVGRDKGGTGYILLSFSPLEFHLLFVGAFQPRGTRIRSDRAVWHPVTEKGCERDADPINLLVHYRNYR